MDPTLFTEVLKSGGIMGVVFLIVVVPLALYAKSQASELKQVQERRALDAQAIVDKLLSLNDRWNNIVAEQTRTVAALDVTLTDVKDVLNSTRDLLMQQQRRP